MSDVAAELSGRVRGAVLVPGEEAYDKEATGFQRGDRHRPDVLVVAEDAADVRAALACARAHGLPLAVQATGHGLSQSARGGVLVSTRRMKGIQVDAEARTAWIEAGVQARDLVAEAARHGLAPVNGSAPGVGMVSYVLGGGLGLLGRQFGFAADHVRRIALVTGEARPCEVTAESDPELFWALRGGGAGHFGVVTGIEIELVPVEQIYGGRLVFDGGEAAEGVVNGWREWTRTVPEELTSAVSLLPMPDFPGVPEGLRGRYLAQVHIAFTGSEEEGERLVAPLRGLGPLLVDEVRTRPYTECASVFAEPEAPHSYRSANALLSDGFGPEEARSVLALTGPEAEAMCVLSVRHLGGAFAREPAEPNAVPHRDASFLLTVLSPLDGTDTTSVRALHSRVTDAVRARTVGRSLNFLYGPQDAAVVRDACTPGTLERLRKLKAEHDPQGLLRFTLGLPAPA